MMLSNKLFSGIYIAGTALAIATTTIVAVAYYVKLAPVYPEQNRARMAVMWRGLISGKEGGANPGMQGQGSLGYQVVSEAMEFKNAEIASAQMSYTDDFYVGYPDGTTSMMVVKPTDAAFFRIFSYKFTEGKPFTQDDHEAHRRVAVITGGAARKIFGTDRDVVGKTVSINFNDYEVTGVVEGGSSVNQASYAEIFIPYTTYPNYEKSWAPMVGNFMIYFITDNIDGLKKEFAEVAHRFNSTNPDYELEPADQPYSTVEYSLNYFMQPDFTIWKFVRDNLIILLVLLLVPALNLSGMISSRMEMRQAELGVRKAFGARRGRLLSQVVWENLLLTVTGGIFGFILCYGLIVLMGGELVDMVVNSSVFHDEGELTLRPDVLFSPLVFVITFALCVVLNLLSAVLPSWLSLRRPIVSSLKDK